MTSIIQSILGLVLLIAGRKLYWLFVGIVGFMLGINLATLLFAGESELARLAIALIVGVIGAVLAQFVQRLAVGLAGFISGGYILVSVFEFLGGVISVPGMPAYWVLFGIGGLIGAVLVAVLFDWALIVLSSLAGAGLVVQILAQQGWVQVFVYIVLIILGIVLQGMGLRKERG
jgi:hypothetical protein